jgi:hypothetical protein
VSALRGEHTHRFSLEEIGEAYRVFSSRLDGVLKVATRP